MTAVREEPRRVLALDVVRGLSILMVMLTHQAVFPEVHGLLYAPVVLLHKIGWSGVDVFFVLSGFSSAAC